MQCEYRMMNETREAEKYFACLCFLLLPKIENMDSRRQLKMSSVIQEVFADILTREGMWIYGKAFVTVTVETVVPIVWARIKSIPK